MDSDILMNDVRTSENNNTNATNNANTLNIMNTHIPNIIHPTNTNSSDVDFMWEKFGCADMPAFELDENGQCVCYHPLLHKVYTFSTCKSYEEDVGDDASSESYLLCSNFDIHTKKWEVHENFSTVRPGVISWDGCAVPLSSKIFFFSAGNDQTEIHYFDTEANLFEPPIYMNLVLPNIYYHCTDAHKRVTDDHIGGMCRVCMSHNTYF